VVLDSWALMAFLGDEEPAATVVQDLLEEAERGRQQLAMSMLNLREVYYRLIAERGQTEADQRLRQIQRLSVSFEPVDDDLVLAAAQIKGAHGVGYADAFAAALALRLDARLATGDTDFKPLETGAGLRMRWLSRDGKK
jgi:uncharacterized protein